jgi:hypothetical protein
MAIKQQFLVFRLSVVKSRAVLWHTVTVKWGFSGKKSGSLEELLWKILDSRRKFLGAVMTLDLSSPAESHITF